MKTIKYLSPTSLKQFSAEPAEFYMQRLADNAPPRFKQTAPMSVGSSFDAYVKAYLHRLFVNDKDPEFKLENLLKTQIEYEDFAWAVEAGKVCFEAYKLSGALSELEAELRLGYNIVFESTVRGEVEGVTLLGKPDLAMTIADAIFILDWKVNGYCSNSNVSPAKNYMICRDGWEGKHSRSHFTKHKNVELIDFNGMTIGDIPLEESNEDWARQVCTYSWLLGAPVGSEICAGIDQLACGKPGAIRIASIRAKISEKFQLELIEEYKECWAVVNMNPTGIRAYFKAMGVDTDDLDSTSEMLATTDKSYVEMMGRG